MYICSHFDNKTSRYLICIRWRTEYVLKPQKHKYAFAFTLMENYRIIAVIFLSINKVNLIKIIFSVYIRLTHYSIKFN